MKLPVPDLTLPLIREWNDQPFPVSPPSSFIVDYDAVTPRGSRARFQRRVGLPQIRMAKSETAVLYYLKQKHPGCDIIIRDLQFK